ncbi:MAG: DUF2442 domain-containing protein [Oligoflexia bacterium]|nr:DUF2442 domain-containing protein [Oligoflexia bacterium]
MIRPKVVKVEPVEDYKLILSFNNGERKIFDVRPYLNLPLFMELKNITIFNTVRVEGLSIAWKNGQDLCPDDLYENSISMTPVAG